MLGRLSIAVAVTILPANVATAQDVPPASPPDVVVVADRPLTEDEEKRASTGFQAPGYDPDATGDIFEASKRAARCAVNGNLVARRLFRQVVDGRYNSSAHDRAQDWVVRQTLTCGMGPSTIHDLNQTMIGRAGSVSYTRDATASMSEIGVLHRGAFVIQALNSFAPDLILTRDQLHDPIVQARFRLREGERNRQRTPIDLRYLQVAVCLVRERPVDAVTMVRTDRAGPVRRLAARMVAASPDCTGGARRVGFDPFQMRAYIGEAVYRWALAVRNQPSLIPVENVATLVDTQPIR